MSMIRTRWPLGGMIVRDHLVEPFLQGTNTFLHGITFGGHPVSTAVALANLDVMENEGVLQHVRANEGAFRATLEKLRDAYASDPDPAKQKAIAEQVQLRVLEYPTHAPLGQFTTPTALRGNIDGLLLTPSLALWNIEKK